MVPTIVTAHMSCASRDTWVSHGWCLLIQGCFLPGLKLCGEAELSWFSWYPKKKIRANHAFFRGENVGPVFLRTCSITVANGQEMGYK